LRCSPKIFALVSSSMAVYLPEQDNRNIHHIYFTRSLSK
jgi:hypothetical protein